MERERTRILSKLLKIGVTTLLLILALTVSAYYFPETMKVWIYFPLVSMVMLFGIVVGVRGVDALNRNEGG